MNTIELNGPIIKSLLDIDFYKFTMGQVVFNKYRHIPVVYGFTNRTKSVLLGQHISEAELREQLDHARTLRFGNSELHYLRGTNEYQERMFSEDYLQFLKHLQLPEYELTYHQGGAFTLRFPGKWSEAIYWETIALSIVNELYYRSLLKKMTRFERDAVLATGVVLLESKVDRLLTQPQITFSEFGTRRRFSRAWQYYVADVMAHELPGQMIGSSNTYIAMEQNLLPIGTSAHEMYMVMSGVGQNTDEAILASHNQTLQDWWEQYGWGLSIALTDTYGTDFFFRDMTAEQAAAWKGLRQDSGDPIAFGEKAIAFYEGHGINPKDKLIIFSDGLDIDKIIEIHHRFDGRIKTSFGWGTNLTNDLGLKPLSLVVKAIESNGRPTVKLSDNMAKATGPADQVARFKRVFGHVVAQAFACTY